MWHTAENSSAKFYNILVKQRRFENMIIGLWKRTTDNRWNKSEKSSIELFWGSILDHYPLGFWGLLPEIPISITDEMNCRQTTAAVTEEKVLQALFIMHPEKASGLNGMKALFIQHACHITKFDILEIVNTFLWTWRLDIRLTMIELRPIRLFNIRYKIILKFLCHRFKNCLPC